MMKIDLKTIKKKLKRMNIKKIKSTLAGSSLLILLLTFGIAFGAYTINTIYQHYIETKGFYFNSSTMTERGSSHSISNWDGVNAYPITIDVNTVKNQYVRMDTDVEYSITVSCSENVTCVTSKESGIVRADTNQDSFGITIYPLVEITQEDVAIVNISVTSSEPYAKTLSTVYEVGIETYSFSWNINDAPGQKFLEMEFNNSFAYYEVTQAFSGHNVGDRITVNQYEQLSDANKLKCKSANVTFSFDPTKLKLDMLNSTYLNNKISEQTQVIDGYNYVKSFVFRMKANESKKIILYKEDSTKDYSTGTSAGINVTVDTVG